jgi:hypothetical protein
MGEMLSGFVYSFHRDLDTVGCRTWQTRRVVYTKESIFFAREDDETETKIDE